MGAMGTSGPNQNDQSSNLIKSYQLDLLRGFAVIQTQITSNHFIKSLPV